MVLCQLHGGAEPLTDGVEAASLSIGGAGSSRRVAALEAELHGLRQRAATQGVIEQAKGMLMAHYSISSEVAFAVLRRWSQQSNVKLRDIAADVVTAGCAPSPRPVGPLRILLDTLASESQSPS